jgi:hypothetical protein
MVEEHKQTTILNPERRAGGFGLVLETSYPSEEVTDYMDTTKSSEDESRIVYLRERLEPAEAQGKGARMRKSNRIYRSKLCRW